MDAIQIQNQPGRYVISIDKEEVSQEFMLGLLERIQLERLARNVDFNESILALGEELNAGWWQQNKHRFIKE
ncbi:MAG: hypothetical protein H7319_19075 [Spirosoma sp.]|nr:hypothetical protein [Spirosoma sp.]